MGVPSDLQVILGANDADTLRDLLPTRPTMNQNELDDCLVSVMREGTLGVIKILLEQGAKLTVLSYHYAIAREDTEILQLLVDHGWDIDSSAEFDSPAVMAALRYEKTLCWLLDSGADPNTMSQRLRGSLATPCTPLVVATDTADTTGLRILLSYGAKLDPLALFYAIGVGRGHAHGVEAMALLIEHGADVNYPSEKWSTPLHQAIRKNSVEKLKTLLAHGADPMVRCAAGKTSPLEFAKQCGRMDLHEILANVCTDGTP